MVLLATSWLTRLEYSCVPCFTPNTSRFASTYCCTGMKLPHMFGEAIEVPLMLASAVSELAPADQMLPPGVITSGFRFSASVTPQLVKLEGPLSLLGDTPSFT